MTVVESVDALLIPRFSVILTQEHIIKSRRGSVSVVVYGDRSKPALVTYPDVALNRKFQDSIS